MAIHSHRRLSNNPSNYYFFILISSYQYLIDVDNLSDELKYVIKKISGVNVEMEKIQTFGKRRRQILLNGDIDKEILRKVSSLYKRDYEMFGYQYPDPDFV